MDLITIIVPIYNADQYLSRCVESILSQTYLNIEIILINDGSNDLTASICDEYSDRSSKVRVIHQKNMGVSCARNAGIEMALGEYISFIDADDVVSSDYIYFLYQTLSNKNCDIAICGVDYLNDIERAKQAPIVDIPDDVYVMTGEDAVMSMLYQKKIDNGPVAKLYSIDLFSEERFQEGIAIAEDLDFNYRLFLRANKIGVSLQKKYMYWQRPGSAMKSTFNPKRMDGLTVLDQIRSDASANHPNMLNSVRNRQFIEAVVIASEIWPHRMYYKEEFSRCKLLISKSGRKVYLDKRSKVRFRAYAGLSLVSPYAVILLFTLKKLIR